MLLRIETTKFLRISEYTSESARPRLDSDAAEPRPEPTPEKRAEREAEHAYFENAEERSKTLVNQPAPELSVAEWVSGSPISIGDLKGKTVALHFWHSVDFDVHPVRLLDALQEIYREKGLGLYHHLPRLYSGRDSQATYSRTVAVPPNRARSANNSCRRRGRNLRSICYWMVGSNRAD